MDALPYYKWFWIDYRANRKVQRMSWQARGLYRELLDEFWSEGILPKSTTELADICMCDHATFLLYWPEIQGCWEETNEGLVNAKMDAQRTEVDTARAAKARAGAKGGKSSNSSTRGKQMEASAKQVQAQPDIAEQSGADLSRAEQEQKRPDEERALRTIRAPSAATLAAKVQERTGILTESSLRVLTSVCRREQNMGLEPDAIVEAMSESWREYQKGPAGFGADKFFGEGHWKTDARRENGNFKGKTESSLNAAQRAIEAIENRAAAGTTWDSETSEAGPGGLSGVRSGPKQLRAGGHSDGVQESGLPPTPGR